MSPTATTLRATPLDAEERRLDESRRREKHWKRWGPYLSERAWGTVREDYSPGGTAWDVPPARPRPLARLPLERGRHRRHLRPPPDALLRARALERRATRSSRSGSSASPARRATTARTCKELYYYLDSTPTHSYMRMLYKYPQAAVSLRGAACDENRAARPRRPASSSCSTPASSTRTATSTSSVEYAKADAEDILVRIDGDQPRAGAARLHLLPTLWFRNTWSWGRRRARGRRSKRSGDASGAHGRRSHRARRSRAASRCAPTPSAEWLFTENETNAGRLWGAPNAHAVREGRLPRPVVDGPRERGEPRARSAPRPRLDPAHRPAGGDAGASGCGSPADGRSPGAPASATTSTRSSPRGGRGRRVLRRRHPRRAQRTTGAT